MEQLAEELIPTRTTLLVRLKDWQDHSGWQDFFDTYWNLIYGVALKGGLTPAEAEDAVQETMISVAKHMPGFKYDPAIGSFKGWLLTMTRWRITDQLRKRGPQGSQEEGNIDEVGQEKDAVVLGSDLEKLWDAEWEANLLKVALSRAKRRLDPKQYQIFDFYVNKEWSPEKIARIYEIPVGQVYLAKHRVTETIRHEVERLKKDII
jgi:RNA polymerase sigma-70 factor (ECF subfamily)